jgi:vacuolar protein sorting-associated protein 29
VALSSCRPITCLFFGEEFTLLRDESALLPRPSYTTSDHLQATNSDVKPSFVLMDIQDSSVVTYVYKLVGDDVKVEKIDYSKK